MKNRHFEKMILVAVGCMLAEGAAWGGSVEIGILKAANRVAEDQVAEPIPPPPVWISQQPVSQTILAGQKATFTVVANGNGLTYQWQRDGVDLSASAGTGAKTATYQTPTTNTLFNGANYRVVVTEISGARVTSNAASLIVLPSGPVPTVPGTPTLTQQSTTSVYAVWTPSTISSGSVQYGYELSSRSDFNSNLLGLHRAGCCFSQNNQTITGLIPSYSPFYVRVRAVDSSYQNISNWSAVSSITITP